MFSIFSGCEIEKDSDSFQQNYESYSSFEQPSEFIYNEQSNNLISDDIGVTCLKFQISVKNFWDVVHWNRKKKKKTFEWGKKFTQLKAKKK